MKFEPEAIAIFKQPGHGKSIIDGLHSDPLRQIKLLNADSRAQNIDDIIENLRRIETQKRQQRVSLFTRLFGKSISFNPESPQYQLKNSTKINIQRIRQYSYDSKEDSIQIKEFPCFCSSCLGGSFDQCQLYNQKIIKVLIENRKSNVKNAEISDPEDLSDHNSEKDGHKKEPNISIDIEYLNDEYPEEMKQSEKNEENESFGSEACSLPEKTNQTSSQKQDKIPNLADFGNLDISMDDFDYVQHRINNMVSYEQIKPTKYFMEKKSLEELFKRNGLVDSFTLNYVGYMYLTQFDTKDCYVFDPQISRYLAQPVRQRPNWQRSLTTHDQDCFADAKRIIIPWHYNSNHWTVVYMNSKNKTIQYFDSYNKPPKLTDMSKIINFVKVSFYQIFLS